MATKAGKNAAVYIGTLPSVNVTLPEPTTDPGDHQNYQITNAAHRYLDPNAVTTLEFSINAGVNWNPVVNSGGSAYTIQWVGGYVRFAVPQSAATLIRFSAGKYFAMSLLGQASEWDLTIGTDLVDVTTFGLAAKAFQPTVRVHTGRFKQFWPDQSMLVTYLGQLFVVQLFVDSAGGTRYEGFAYLKTDGIQAAEGGVLAEDVQFQIHGDIYQV